MSIEMRPYSDDDLPALQAALASWVAAAGDCGYCHVGDLPMRIYGGLRGVRPVGELVQLWQDGPQIVGLAINFLFGAAFCAYAHPAYRGGPAELAMLESAAATTQRLMREAASAEAAVITDVISCDTMRAALLRQLGFEHYRKWDHITERSLLEPHNASQSPAGFTLRPASLEDHAQLALAHNSAFGDDWTPDMYRDGLMRKPGYDPARELVAVTPDGQIAAFTIVWLDELNKVGLFEPVGTHQAFQRRGLGRALMSYGLDVMRQAGMERAVVEHNAENMAAHMLYQSLGFTKKYETLGFRRF
jgi:mycothiol synthase